MCDFKRCEFYKNGCDYKNIMGCERPCEEGKYCDFAPLNRDIVKNNSYARKHAKKTETAIENAEKIKKAYEQGLTDRQIKEFTGLSSYSVFEWRRKNTKPPNGTRHILTREDFNFDGCAICNNSLTCEEFDTPCGDYDRNPDILLTYKEIVELTHIKYSTLNTAARNGAIPKYNVRGMWHVRYCEVERFIEVDILSAETELDKN